MVMVLPPMCDSAVSLCFHGCPAFLHQHIPTPSPPSHPLSPSLCNKQQTALWDCSTIPKLQVPTAVPSRGPVSLSGVCVATARTVWFSFYLGCHISAVSLSDLNVSPLTQTIAPVWGRTAASVPPPAKTKYSPTDTPVFPIVPLSYRVLHGSIYYFPLARYSCLLSACVLHALLCLKVYSGCIHGERYTPRPSTPLPSCPHERTFINILSSPTNQPSRIQKHFSLWGS